MKGRPYYSVARAPNDLVSHLFFSPEPRVGAERGEAVRESHDCSHCSCEVATRVPFPPRSLHSRVNDQFAQFPRALVTSSVPSPHQSVVVKRRQE